MWWFAAVHANLLAGYFRVCGDKAEPPRVLDAGCGTGGFLAKLAARFPGSAVMGLDYDPHAGARARAKSGRPVAVGSVNSLPFADGGFAAIFSADVLCHAGVDGAAAVAEFRRCLAPRGVLVLNLPAYPWLLSRHDVAVANVRRYTWNSASRLLRAGGFRLLYASYWNSLLFPAMVLSRKLARSGPGGDSDVGEYPPRVDALCRAATRFEEALLRRGFRFWFGGSLLVVAARDENEHG